MFRSKIKPPTHMPSVLTAVTGPPLPTRKRTASSWPLRTAWCSAVLPALSVSHTAIPSWPLCAYLRSRTRCPHNNQTSHPMNGWNAGRWNAVECASMPSRHVERHPLAGGPSPSSTGPWRRKGCGICVTETPRPARCFTLPGRGTDADQRGAGGQARRG